MGLPLPSTLTPSKVSAFTSCALAFRFAVVDRLPESPAPHTVKGTLVHRALQLLFSEHPRGQRTPEAAQACLARTWAATREEGEFRSLGLDETTSEAFVRDAGNLLQRYFDLEDPNQVTAIGLELSLSARLGGAPLRGIIDRLDLLPDGELAVVDYKTGRAPDVTRSRSRLASVHFYAYLCEQVTGRRPAEVRLMYLRDRVVVAAEPSDQAMRGLRQRTGAVWEAIERACERDAFLPNPSGLCTWCSFRELCPVFGGDPGRVEMWLAARASETSSDSLAARCAS